MSLSGAKWVLLFAASQAFACINIKECELDVDCEGKNGCRTDTCVCRDHLCIPHLVPLDAAVSPDAAAADSAQLDAEPGDDGGVTNPNDAATSDSGSRLHLFGGVSTSGASLSGGTLEVRNGALERVTRICNDAGVCVRGGLAP